jgi:hypothetical protein
VLSLRGLSDFGHFEKADALKCPRTRFSRVGRLFWWSKKTKKAHFRPKSDRSLQDEINFRRRGFD